MNERIQQFAKEAGAYFGDASVDYFGEAHPAFVDTSNIDLEKFARLIIRECMFCCDIIEQVEWVNPPTYEFGVQACKVKMQTHFWS